MNFELNVLVVNEWFVDDFTDVCNLLLGQDIEEEKTHTYPIKQL